MNLFSYLSDRGRTTTSPSGAKLVKFTLALLALLLIVTGLQLVTTGHAHAATLHTTAKNDDRTVSICDSSGQADDASLLASILFSYNRANQSTDSAIISLTDLAKYGSGSANRFGGQVCYGQLAPGSSQSAPGIRLATRLKTLEAYGWYGGVPRTDEGEMAWNVKLFRNPESIDENAVGWLLGMAAFAANGSTALNSVVGWLCDIVQGLTIPGLLGFSNAQAPTSIVGKLIYNIFDYFGINKTFIQILFSVTILILLASLIIKLVVSLQKQQFGKSSRSMGLVQSIIVRIFIMALIVPATIQFGTVVQALTPSKQTLDDATIGIAQNYVVDTLAWAVFSGMSFPNDQIHAGSKYDGSPDDAHKPTTATVSSISVASQANLAAYEEALSKTGNKNSSAEMINKLRSGSTATVNDYFAVLNRAAATTDKLAPGTGVVGSLDFKKASSGIKNDPADAAFDIKSNETWFFNKPSNQILTQAEAAAGAKQGDVEAKAQLDARQSAANDYVSGLGSCFDPNSNELACPRDGTRNKATALSASWEDGALLGTSADSAQWQAVQKTFEDVTNGKWKKLSTTCKSIPDKNNPNDTIDIPCPGKTYDNGKGVTAHGRPSELAAAAQNEFGNIQDDEGVLFCRGKLTGIGQGGNKSLRICVPATGKRDTAYWYGIDYSSGSYVRLGSGDIDKLLKDYVRKNAEAHGRVAEEAATKVKKDREQEAALHDETITVYGHTYEINRIKNPAALAPRQVQPTVPTSYLYGYISAGALDEYASSAANYIYGENNQLKSINPATAQKETDTAGAKSLAQNAVAIAALNKGQGSSNAFTQQSIAFLLQSDIANDKISYAGFNTAANETADSKNTGTNGSSFLRYTMPAESQSVMTQHAASLAIIFVMAFLMSISILVCLLKAPVFGSLLNALTSFVKAILTGSPAAAARAIIWTGAVQVCLLTAGIAMFFGVGLGSMIVGNPFVRSSLAASGTAASGTASFAQTALGWIPFAGSGLASTVGNALGGAITGAAGIIMLGLGILFIIALNVPVLKLPTGNGSDKVSIIFFLVGLPFIIAESLDQKCAKLDNIIHAGQGNYNSFDLKAKSATGVLAKGSNQVHGWSAKPRNKVANFVDSKKQGLQSKLQSLSPMGKAKQLLSRKAGGDKSKDPDNKQITPGKNGRNANGKKPRRIFGGGPAAKKAEKSGLGNVAPGPDRNRSMKPDPSKQKGKPDAKGAKPDANGNKRPGANDKKSNASKAATEQNTTKSKQQTNRSARKAKDSSAAGQAEQGKRNTSMREANSKTDQKQPNRAASDKPAPKHSRSKPKVDASNNSDDAPAQRQRSYVKEDQQKYANLDRQ